MDLIVETGAGVAGANSYTSLESAQEFLDARGYSVTLTTASLLRAMDQLNSARYLGRKSDPSNALPFPRADLLDCEGNEIPSDVVPAEMATAQIWLAYYIEQGSDPSAVATPAIKMEKVDVIEVEYAVTDGDTTSISLWSLPNVRNALRCFLAAQGRIDRA